jgi:hypothetical protein
MRRLISGAAVAVAGLTCVVAASAEPYKLESIVTLPGPSPAWDYLSFDPTRDYLFIGRRAQGVTVYDTTARRVVGHIENSEGANVATLVPVADRGFTANEDGSTTVFQLSTLKTLSRVKLGAGADAAFYEPVTGQVVFTLGDSRELVFIDAHTARPIGRLQMGAEELEAAVSDGRGYLYVNERDKDRVAKVDARTRRVVAKWRTTGCHMPTGLAMDPASARLFLGCKGDQPVLAVMDADSGRVVTTLEIGRGNDGVAFDPARRRIFTSNGVDANVVVFDEVGPDSYKLATAFTTRPIARTMALDPKSGRVYTVTAEGMVDPTKPVNKRAGAFYPNSYFDDTFTLLTYAPQ